jgi:hypothetical protein
VSDDVHASSPSRPSSVTAADAEENLATVDALAANWAAVIDDALVDARARRSARPEVRSSGGVRAPGRARIVFRAPSRCSSRPSACSPGWCAALTHLFAVVIRGRTTETSSARSSTTPSIGIIAVNALGFDPGRWRWIEAEAVGGLALRHLSNFVSGHSSCSAAVQLG